VFYKAAWPGAGLLEPVQRLRAAGGALTSLFEWPLGAKQGWCSAMGWRGAEAWSTLPAYYRSADYPPGSVREVLQKPAEADGHGMRVMSQSPDPLARMHTMTKRQGKSGTIEVKAILAEDEEFLRALVRTALQEVLEVEMTEALGAEKGERAAGRQGYRSGYYGRMLITRVGKLELRVPQDRSGRFSTELFERYQRSERALVAALAEMYVQGVSTRKSLPSRKRG